MTEHVKQKHLLAIDRMTRAWSVSFDPNSVSPDGTREDLAANMVANVAVGDQKVRNDFDRVSIFKRPIFNATWDSTKGCWVDLVAQGEAGFTFSPTQENREVVYRCQPFWYKLGFDGRYGPNFVSVTDRPLEGYQLAPMFRDGETYEYRPCFELALGSDGKPHSRAGLEPFEDLPVELMQKVFSYDSNARTETMADWFCDYLLLMVEFGTRNLQNLMRGATRGSLPIWLVNEEEEREDYEYGIYTSERDSFVIGKTYRMFYRNEVDAWSYREAKLLAIEEIPYGDEEDEMFNYLLRFDVEENIVYDYLAIELFEKPYTTGAALPYVSNATSGRRDADVYSPCVWRGKENPWGNMSSFICDVLFDVLSTMAAPYVYMTDDIKAFDGTKNSAYKTKSYLVKTRLIRQKGYIAAFTRAGDEDHILVPADFQFDHPQHHFATYAAIIPISKLGLHYLRVGGDYRVTGSINHATYEMQTASRSYSLFGGRLILQEGV